MKQHGIEMPDWTDLVPPGMTEESSSELQRWLLRNKKMIQLAENRFMSTDILEEIIQSQ